MIATVSSIPLIILLGLVGMAIILGYVIVYLMEVSLHLCLHIIQNRLLVLTGQAKGQLIMQVLAQVTATVTL